MPLTMQSSIQKIAQLMPEQMLCAALELMANKAITLNIATDIEKQLHQLEQKTLAVTLSELGFTLCFTITNKKLLITTLTERADCEIHTSIKTLQTLNKHQQLTELIKQEKLDVIGELKVAQQFAHIAETFEIDWQSELARYIGDIPTYQLEQFGKNTQQKLAFAAEQIQADLSEWLIYEQNLIVPQHEINHFNQQVNKAAISVLAIEARLEQLTAHIKTPLTAAKSTPLNQG